MRLSFIHDETLRGQSYTVLAQITTDALSMWFKECVMPIKYLFATNSEKIPTGKEHFVKCEQSRKFPILLSSMQYLLWHNYSCLFDYTVPIGC